MNKQEYFEIAQQIWQKEVPKSGQSKTVQGELIRSIEKLRDEAQRNGNANRDDGHQIMLAYIAEILLNHDAFTEAQKNEITQTSIELADARKIIIEDEPYDFLTERVIDWYQENKTGNERVSNPVLKR